MNWMKRLAVVAMSCLAGTGIAFAQGYPEKPVKVIVPYSAGTATDTMARLFAQKLSEKWGHQVVVEKVDPRGRKYYWIAGTPEWREEEGTDYVAMASGYASVTPLHLDLTDYRVLDGAAALRDHLERSLGTVAPGRGE